MKINFHIKRWLVIVIALVVLWIGAISIDYYRARHQQDPLFTFSTWLTFDGGTVTRYGLGYKVIHFNQMEYYGGRTDVIFEFGWRD